MFSCLLEFLLASFANLCLKVYTSYIVSFLKRIISIYQPFSYFATKANGFNPSKRGSDIISKKPQTVLPIIDLLLLKYAP